MKSGLRRKLPTLIIIFLILIVSAISVRLYIDRRDDPTSKRQNLYDYYLEDTDSAAIIVNGNLTSVRALIINKQPYVTLGLVTGEINSHFYYETSSGKLLCTNADKVTSIRKNDNYNGSPVIYDSGSESASKAKLSDDERLYVQLSYVASLTEIEIQYYSSPARVFIRSRFGSVTAATACEGACMRTAGSDSGLVLHEYDEASELWVVSTENGWNLVCDETLGLSGYMTTAELTAVTKTTRTCSYIAPEYEYRLMTDDVCLVWHQVLSDSGLSVIDDLLDKTEYANVISPTWFSVTDSDGTIESRANEEYVAKVRERGLKIWALVENFNTDNTLDYDILLGTSASRTRMIESLISEATNYGLDGINVDFEGLPSSSGEAYVQFIRELSIACREHNLVLSVDCYVPSAWTTHYHRDALAEAADYIVIMAYDEHYVGSDAGSTSSLSFVQAGITDTINEGVPADRIIVGIPFYSRVWKGDGISLTSSTINMQDMQKTLEQAGETAVWDDSCSQYYIEWTQDDVVRRLWVENYDSLTEKLNLIKQYDVAGIAGWKLGMESADAWTAVGEYLN